MVCDICSEPLDPDRIWEWGHKTMGPDRRQIAAHHLCPDMKRGIWEAIEARRAAAESACAHIPTDTPSAPGSESGRPGESPAHAE